MYFTTRQLYRLTNEKDDSSATITAKAVAMVMLCTVSITVGLMPLRLKSCFKVSSNMKENKYISMLLGLGGGVLLCTTFLHLLPEVSENVEDLQANHRLPDYKFPLAELMMCTGFFTMYLVEEIAHLYIHKRNKKQTVAEEVLSRTLSIRRKSNETPAETKITTSDVEQAQNGLNHHEHNHNGHNHHQHNHHEPNHQGHSHFVLEEDATVMSLRGLLVVLALSIHELFEGLAVGLESKSSTVWYMFGAVSCHKFVIAFCIGVELVSSGTRTLLTVIYVCMFAVVSPMGIGIGIALTQASSANVDIPSIFLQGLATGTLLYVVFFEILQKERTEGLKQYLSIIIGFGIMFGLQSIFVDD